MKTVILIAMAMIALAGCGHEGEGVVIPTGSYYVPAATPAPQRTFTPAPTPTPCPPGTQTVPGWWGTFSCQ